MKKEFKPTRKSLWYYYGIVMLVLLVCNAFVFPMLAGMQVQEVDYGTFMRMTDEKQIGQVDIQYNQIVFTDKEAKNIYKTGVINDEGLVDRLYASGAQLSSEIIEEASPLVTLLLN